MTLEQSLALVHEGLCDATVYTDRQIDQAYRLLSTLDYDPVENTWDERRRFQLFSSLCKIASAYALDAEGPGDDRYGRLTELASIAQCAMELVCRGMTWTPELIWEICSEDDEAADSFSVGH